MRRRDTGSRHPRPASSHGESEPAAATDEATDAGEGRSLGSIVDAATGPVMSVARPIGRRVGAIAAGAQRSYHDSGGARVRRVRRMGRQPLANLYRVHPGAYQAAPRGLGLRTVPVSSIKGTAVDGPTQRGGDFLPLRDLRGADWQGRWQRIRQALEQLVDLPPVDLVKYGDSYWVVDGHNRVGAALYNGQVAVDANVTELRAPGLAVEPSRPMAPYLQGSSDLRAAGEGRLSRGATRPDEWDELPLPSAEGQVGVTGSPDDVGHCPGSRGRVADRLAPRGPEAGRMGEDAGGT